MRHDRSAPPIPGRGGTGIAAKFRAAFALILLFVLLTGIWGWRTVRALEYETGTIQPTSGAGDASALSGSGGQRFHRAELEFAASGCLGVALLFAIYLYLSRSVVRPLRENARLMGLLATGDCSEDVPAGQLARNDEIGVLARAIQELAVYQRGEVNVANGMSAGDFTGSVTVRGSSDMLGLAIQKMADVTGGAIKHIDAHATRVMAGCAAIVQASRELSAKGDDIRVGVSEIATRIEQIKTHADGNADMAKEIGRLTDAGSRFVDRGYEGVGEMGAVMLDMQACGDKIVGIAKSIGEIAFQTNLLALNASVEAARAGRHGRGFAIVAQEVRSLADRASRAANETSTMMQETVNQVELAAAVVGKINSTFAEMQARIQEIGSLMTKLTAASGQQMRDIGGISTVLHRVDRIARESAEQAGDVLVKTDTLIGRTERLRRMIGRFRLRRTDAVALDEPVAASLPATIPQFAATIGGARGNE